jgi:pimeloyl-ACP methyl ester carboxylesterase
MTDSHFTRRTALGVMAAAGVGGELVGAARAQGATKTFVLIHGTFCGAWMWRRVADLLQKQGHRVFTPTLTGLGERSHLLSKDINLDTHITDVVNVVNWEDLGDICLVAHSYGGWIGSGALERIGDHVASIVWLDAYKPDDGQKPLDLTNEGFRKAFLNAAEKGEPGFAPPLGAAPISPIWVNERDSAYVLSKLTPQPVGTYFQPIRLSGAREKAAKKTYIRATVFPNPAFDKALAACQADKSWRTLAVKSGHVVMLDQPEWLADTLVQAA